MAKLFFSRKKLILACLFFFTGSFYSSSKANIASNVFYVAKGLGTWYTGIGLCAFAASLPVYLAVHEKSSSMAQVAFFGLSVSGISLTSLGTTLFWLGSR